MGPGHRMRVPALIAALLLAAAAGAGASPGPLEDLTNTLIHGGALEGRSPDDYKWSPDGSRLGFLRRPPEGKTPALHVYEVAAKRTTPLTLPAAGEEGAGGPPEISSFEWSPGGDRIVAVVKGDLYLFEGVAGAAPGTARRLVKTDATEKDARFSPDGRLVGFLRDHNVWVLDPATGESRPLTAGNPEGVWNGEVDWVYEEEFAISRGWWWSPDSSRVAYMQFDQRMVPTYPIVDWIPTHPEVERQHYPKAGDSNAVVKVGIVEARAAGAGSVPPTRWLDLGSDPDIYVPRVEWTADPATVAVQRLNRDQTRLELLLFDAGTGSGRLLLEEKDPLWINIGDDWRFLGDRKRLLWGSERDGHRHLYLYALDGTLVRRLTDGAWDITELSAVDEKAGRVCFMSTRRGPAQRHLDCAGLDGSAPRSLTGEEGWHATWVASTGAFVDEHSTAMTPERSTIRGPDGAIIDTLDEGMAAEISKYRRGRVEFREVPAPDGTSLPAMITLPPDFDASRRHPVLVYVYGGPHAQVVANRWRGALSLWHQMMAARGVIVWSLDNRGMGGRGHAWESPIYRSMGRQELADQIAGVDHLKRQPWVDPARIGIWGWSYGGYMTLYSLLNAPDVFRAGVAVAPVVHWSDYDTIYTERYMDRPSDNPGGYRESAPLEKAPALKSPLLLVHGSSDDNVHLQNSIQMLDAFVAAGRPVEFMLYPRKNHSIPGPAPRTHLYEKITRFLTSHLLTPGGAP